MIGHDGNAGKVCETIDGRHSGFEVTVLISHD
jgi:hypothetical protein